MDTDGDGARNQQWECPLDHWGPCGIVCHQEAETA